MDLLDDPLSSNRVDLSSFNNSEATISIMFVIAQPTQSSADASMDVRIVPQQAFHGRMVEVGSVVDCGYFAGRASEYLGFPSISACSGVSLGWMGLEKHMPVEGDGWLTSGCQSESP